MISLRISAHLKKVIVVRKLSTTQKQTNVCIVGAGPAGFYAAMHLTKKVLNVNVDFIEKLPVPFGLIRYGVAPDHPEVKNVLNQFTKVAQQRNVHFYGNITVGKDVTLTQLRQHYDAVLLSYGADEDKTLGIENENNDNIISARRFVGWYNGHPEDKDLKIDLTGSTAAILGQGNVALDISRILLTPLEDLRKTDITEHALNSLAHSKVKELYLIGRRGPLHVAFTIKELREQLKLNGCSTLWRTQDFNGVADLVANLPRPRKRLTELMLKSVNEMSSYDQNNKLFRPIFYRSPKRFLINEAGLLSGIELICNKLKGDKLDDQMCVPTNETETLACQLAFRSIGYKCVNIDNGLTFDSHRGILSNDNGRINDEQLDRLAKLYVAGWLGTGPVGVILHTMGHAFQVAKLICDDLQRDNYSKTTPGFKGIQKLLMDQNVQIVDWHGWERIDEYEVIEGKKLGKPREKVCSINDMLNIACVK